MFLLLRTEFLIIISIHVQCAIRQTVWNSLKPAGRYSWFLKGQKTLAESADVNKWKGSAKKKQNASSLSFKTVLAYSPRPSPNGGSGGLKLCLQLGGRKCTSSSTFIVAWERQSFNLFATSQDSRCGNRARRGSHVTGSLGIWDLVQKGLAEPPFPSFCLFLLVYWRHKGIDIPYYSVRSVLLFCLVCLLRWWLIYVSEGLQQSARFCLASIRNVNLPIPAQQLFGLQLSTAKFCCKVRTTALLKYDATRYMYLRPAGCLSQHQLNICL